MRYSWRCFAFILWNYQQNFVLHCLWRYAPILGFILLSSHQTFTYTYVNIIDDVDIWCTLSYKNNWLIIMNCFLEFLDCTFHLMIISTLALKDLHWSSCFAVFISSKIVLSAITISLDFILLPRPTFWVLWSLAEASIVKYPSSAYINTFQDVALITLAIAFRSLFTIVNIGS